MDAVFEQGAGWQGELTRREVAKRLGVSVSTVRRMEGVELHPIQDHQGIWRFAEDEVRKAAKSRRPGRSRYARAQDGPIAARVFKAFAAGHTLREIVIEHEVHPAVVRDLYAHWLVRLEDGEEERRDAATRREELREQRELSRLLGHLR